MASGVNVHANILQLDPYTVATVPPAAAFKNCMIYVNNGAGGTPILAVSNGTNWLRQDTGAAIS
jgi:hypothetical protein